MVLSNSKDKLTWRCNIISLFVTYIQQHNICCMVTCSIMCTLGSCALMSTIVNNGTNRSAPIVSRLPASKTEIVVKSK